MSDKDLGEGLEAFENEVENLKNTKMKLFGITMTPTTIGALFAVLSAIGGSLYAGFEFYKDYMDMREVVQNIDTTEIENRNKQIEIKLQEALTRVEEAVDYSRSIKNDLRDDFNRMEKNVDRVEDSLRNEEDKIKGMIDRANERFDLKRDSLASDTNAAIEALENRLNKKIQSALDNPLAN